MSQETIRCPCFKPEIVSQAHKDSYTSNIKIFRKFEKFKFYPKITKIGVIKMLITNPSTLETMQQLIIKTWMSQGLLPEKVQKHEKIANIFKKIA